MQKPFFSILIPCYNAKKYLKQAIDSCFQQSYENYEVILCDNGSVDNVQLMLKEIKNDKFKYFLGKSHVSTIELRNFLIKQAKGEYIIWLQPSDTLSKDFLNEAFEYIKNFKGDIIEFNVVWKVGEQLVEVECKEQSCNNENGIIDVYMNRNDMCQDALFGKIISTQIMKRCVIENIDGIFSAEQVFYSVPLYLNAKSYRRINSKSSYIYNSQFDHFHGLSELSFENIKYMCELRNKQLIHNIKCLNQYGDKYNYNCLEKIGLFSIFNDILNLQDKEQMKEAFNEFYKYYGINLTAHAFNGDYDK